VLLKSPGDLRFTRPGHPHDGDHFSVFRHYGINYNEDGREIKMDGACYET
jgi:hypothetical protein